MPPIIFPKGNQGSQGNKPPEVGLPSPDPDAKPSFRERYGPLLLAGLGAGIGAFTKGGASDFFVGMGTGAASEGYRQFRTREEEKGKTWLAEVEGLRKRIDDLRANDFYGSPELQEATTMWDRAMSDGKLTPKERDEIARKIDASMGKGVPEAFAEGKFRRAAALKGEVEREQATAELERKKSSGELVPYEVKGAGTVFLTPQALAEAEANAAFKTESLRLQEKGIDAATQNAIRSANLQLEIAKLSLAGQVFGAGARAAASGSQIAMDPTTGKPTLGPPPSLEQTLGDFGKVAGALGVKGFKEPPSTSSSSFDLAGSLQAAGGDKNAVLGMIATAQKRGLISGAEAVRLRRELNEISSKLPPPPR